MDSPYIVRKSVIGREITLMDITIHWNCLLSSSQDLSKCLFIRFCDKSWQCFKFWKTLHFKSKSTKTWGKFMEPFNLVDWCTCMWSISQTTLDEGWTLSKERYHLSDFFLNTSLLYTKESLPCILERPRVWGLSFEGSNHCQLNGEFVLFVLYCI